MAFGETIVHLRFGFSVIVALASAASAHAQTLNGWLRVAETRMPLKGARLVLVADSSNAVADSTRVDSTGVFYLNASAPGRYRVVIRPPAGLLEAVFSAPAVLLLSDSTVQREYLVPLAGLVFYEAGVERPVREKGTTTGPKYPPQLEQAGVEGEVLAQFIVDQEGHVVPSSITIIRTTRPEFAAAVRENIRAAQFYPAQIRDRAVSQCATQLFVFHRKSP